MRGRAPWCKPGIRPFFEVRTSEYRTGRREKTWHFFESKNFGENNKNGEPALAPVAQMMFGIIDAQELVYC